MCRVVDIYRELQRYKRQSEIHTERLAALKKSNLYDLYLKTANEDHYEVDLFKAIFEYKVFSKHNSIFEMLGGWLIIFIIYR